MVEPLYQIELTCSLCKTAFRTSRVRPSYRKSVATDSDFCLHFKDGTENPEYYVVRVCPSCGFASTESFSENFSEQAKKNFADKITLRWTYRDFGGKRTWEDALDAYKLALVTAQTLEQSNRVLAGLLHHIAWMYRYKKDKEQEARFLSFALDAYVNVYEYESEQLNDARLMYMIGELNRRLKRYSEAVKWFSRVVNDKSIVDAAMIGASREMWQKTIEQMNEEKSDSAH